MNNRSTVTHFLLAASSFAGGVAMGLLLSPKSGKRNRLWVQNHASDVADWIDEKGTKAVQTGNRKLNKLRSQVHHNLKQNVPDLYHATEHIDLDEFNIIDG